MPGSADENGHSLAELAIARGFITREQAGEAFAVQAQMAQLGVPEGYGKILVKKGFINEGQLGELEARVSPKQPARIGGFEILSRLGRGAMGAVYKARQVSLDRVVALKVLPPALAKDKDFIERFFREARAVARLNHPNIVQGIDVGVADKYYYFAMEYVDGETVQNILGRDGPMDEKRALETALQIAQALHHAHRHDMIHRDIKPDNIMVTTGGVAKLCDLGLAKSLHGESSVTQAGLAVGTPHYISPEQARGDEDVDIRADIYSLGATLYHMVVGRTPYSGSSAAVVLTKHLNEEIPNPRDVRPELSMGIVRLIEKMMAKERSERYQTPEELIRDINLVASGKSPKAVRLAAGRSAVRGATAGVHGARARAASRRTAVRPVEPVAGRKTPATLIAVGTGLLVVTALGIWLGLAFTRNEQNGSLPPPVNGNNNTSNTNNKPPVNPTDLKHQQRVARLQRRFSQICAYWEKHPTEFKKVYDDLRFLKDDARDTPVALRAHNKLQEVLAEQKTHNEAAFQKALAAAEKLIAAGRFGEALGAFDDLPLSPDMIQKANRERQRIAALAMSRFEAIKRRAWDILGPARYEENRQGDLAGAEKHLRTALAFKVSKVTGAVNAELGKLRAAHKQRTDELQKRLAAGIESKKRELRVKFDAARDRVFKLAAELGTDTRLFKFSEARSLARQELVTPEYKLLEAEAQRIERDLALLVKALAELPARIRRKMGQQCSLATGRSAEQGELVAVDRRSISLRPAGMPGSITVFFYRIDPADLAGLGGYSTKSPADGYLIGLLAFYSGRRDKAVRPFEAAASDPKLKPGAEYYLGLSRAAHRQLREAEAGKLLKECRDSFARLKALNVPKGDPQWAALVKELERLKKEYADTETVKKSLGE